MDWLRRRLDFRGRTSRLGYWRTSLEISALVCVTMLIALFAITAVGRVAAVLLLPLPLLLTAAAAIVVRRLHDRGRSAWWALVFYGVPFAIAGVAESWRPRAVAPVLMLLALVLLSWFCSVWGLVEVGFRKGTAGENRFGPDPLTPVARAA